MTATNCASYERMPELRARNMTPLERAYHRMYTRKQLHRLLSLHYDARSALPPRELAGIIAASKAAICTNSIGEGSAISLSWRD